MTSFPSQPRFWQLKQHLSRFASTLSQTLQRLWSPQLRFLRPRWLFLSLIAGWGFALTSLWLTPWMSGTAQAFAVRVSPGQPQLGDTITVTLPTSEAGLTPPTLQMGPKTYPFFPTGDQYRAFLPTTPLDPPKPLGLTISANGQTQALTVPLKKRSFPVQRIWLPPGKDGIDGTDYEFDRVDAFKKLETSEKFWQGPFLRPNAGEITTVYGVLRYYNGVFAKDYYHRGVDYGGGVGSPVIAPAAGRVALVGRVSQGFQLHGNTIGIDHGQGVTSIFLHLSRIDVKEGDFVQPGQRIGAVGATGAVTGPHLHWGLYVHGLAVDPVPWRNQGFE